MQEAGRSQHEVVRRSEGQFLNQNYRTACQQTKEQFAKYVEEMKAKGFAEGKFVVSQSASKPYLDAQIHRIQGLEEMHKFVDDWGTEFSGPTMIYLEYYNKNAAIFKTCPGWYKPLDTELTDGWKERLRDEGAPVDTWSSE